MGNKDVIDAGWDETGRSAQPLSSPSHWFQRAAKASSERVLLVEPDAAQRGHLRDAVRAVAEIDDVADFLRARTQLISKPYDWLLTNIRLGAYNGLHLVHLAGTSRRPIRSLVYEDQPDLWLAREAQRVGAFYESSRRVDRALPAYLRGALPQKDRRDPAEPDRRGGARGGRRCTDSSSAALFA